MLVLTPLLSAALHLRHTAKRSQPVASPVAIGRDHKARVRLLGAAQKSGNLPSTVTGARPDSAHISLLLSAEDLTTPPREKQRAVEWV